MFVLSWTKKDFDKRKNVLENLLKEKNLNLFSHDFLKHIALEVGISAFDAWLVNS